MAGDLSAGTVVLSLIGIAILVALGFVWMELRRPSPPATPQTKEIIVERRSPWWSGYGPYYSHLPVRPLVY